MSFRPTGIYVIRHLTSGRVYVGQAADILNRWTVHKHKLRAGTHHCSYLQRAWIKYGEADFEFKIIQFTSLEELDASETRWYNFYRSRKGLYNLRPPGKSARGFNHSPAVRAKMRIAAKLVANSPEQKLMRSERAKRQHLEGKIGYRSIVRPVRICTNCGNKFNRYKKLKGGYSSGEKCLTCMAEHYNLKGGQFDIESFDVSPNEFDDAAYELTCTRKYPGGI